MDTAALQLEHFSPLVGETFVADFGEEGTLDLVLTEAVERPTGNEHDKVFSLLFLGPVDRTFVQALVSVSHQAIGDHLLLLVAVGESDEGRSYEAVFTRLAG